MNNLELTLPSYSLKLEHNIQSSSTNIFTQYLEEENDRDYQLDE